MIVMNCWVLSLCGFLRNLHWWVGPVVRVDVCPQPIARASVRLVCVVIFLFPWGRSLFGVVVGPARTACNLSGLWHCFGWALAKSILERASLQENTGQLTRFVQVYSGRGPGAVAQLEGVCLQENMGECPISKLGRHYTGSCQYPCI